MRAILLLLLALAGLAFAPAQRSLPTEFRHFSPGMARPQIDSALAARRVRVISDRSGVVSVESNLPGVDLEQYTFLDHPSGSSLLWRVTLTHRLPATRRQFNALADSLGRSLGRPVDDPLDPEGRPNGSKGQRIVWQDSYQRVVLAGRPAEGDKELSEQDSADRTLIIWTDLRIERMVQSQRKKEPKAG